LNAYTPYLVIWILICYFLFGVKRGYNKVKCTLIMLGIIHSTYLYRHLKAQSVYLQKQQGQKFYRLYCGIYYEPYCLYRYMVLCSEVTNIFIFDTVIHLNISLLNIWVYKKYSMWLINCILSDTENFIMTAEEFSCDGFKSFRLYQKPICFF
jgi:hypothetical protein